MLFLIVYYLYTRKTQVSTLFFHIAEISFWQYIKCMNWPDEFLTLDKRSMDPAGRQPYKVTQQYLQHKHRILLPPSLVKDRSILDVGSCLGATGWYSLSNDCRIYLGLEMQAWFCDRSKELLSAHPRQDWQIANNSLQTYMTFDRNHYDIIVAWGVLNGLYDPIPALEWMMKRSDVVSLDLPIPHSATDELAHCSIDLNPNSSMIAAGEAASFVFTGSRIGLGAIQIVANLNGFDLDMQSYDQLRSVLPDYYGTGSQYRRMGINLIRSDTTLPKLDNSYRNLQKENWGE